MEIISSVVPKIVKVDDLIPYKNNPRDNNEEAVNAVVESIKRHGYQERILITEDNVIIRGHTRLKAFKKLGWTEVEALVAKGWTEDQIKSVRLADNRTQELSLIRTKELDLELRELPDVEYAKSLGMTETKAFAEGEFKTTEYDISSTKEKLEAGFEEREEAKQEGMVAIPCPHCDRVFLMKKKDLENKVKYKVREEA